MNLFKYTGEIKSFNTLKKGLESLDIKPNDLIFTSQRVEKNYLKNSYKCHIFCHDVYGDGEPSDHKIDAIKKDLKSIRFNRLIAIGGGSVLDIAKILALKGDHPTIDYFKKKVPIENEHPLIAIPTTCGTGSEVTSITIAYIESLHTKMGLNHTELYPKEAMLIPELLDQIPFKVFIFSIIDALIHAIEAYLSPNSSRYTDLYAKESIRIILKNFKDLSINPSDHNLYNISQLLKASNMAGLAFGNAGVGAVHALSYPLGGKYHVPHGESNYLFLNAVLKTYKSLKPDGKISKLEKIICESLDCFQNMSLTSLEKLLNQLIVKQPLKEYGMTSEEIKNFSEIVIETQERLLKNNYAKLSIDDIERIYKNLF